MKYPCFCWVTKEFAACSCSTVPRCVDVAYCVPYRAEGTLAQRRSIISLLVPLGEVLIVLGPELIIYDGRLLRALHTTLEECASVARL